MMENFNISCLISDKKASFYLDGSVYLIYNRKLNLKEINTIFNTPFCMLRKLTWWKRWRLMPRGRIVRKIHQIKRIIIERILI